MPSPDSVWTPQGYTQGVNVLKSIAQKDARQLPRFRSQASGRVFDRFCSSDNIKTVLEENLPLDRRMQSLLSYLDGVKQALIIYSEPATRGIGFDAEAVGLTGLMLKLVEEVSGVANSFMASIPQADPQRSAREQTFLRLKDSLVTTFDHAITTLGDIDAHTAPARIRLCGHLKETLPLVIGQFPPASQKEIPLRIQRMVANETDEAVKMALAGLYQVTTAALAR